MIAYTVGLENLIVKLLLNSFSLWTHVADKAENSWNNLDQESVWINPNWDFILESPSWVQYVRNAWEVASGHIKECR